ncbi:hypothetical protein AB1K84_14255 [Mesobacillus foraminis]|uniref:Uncharacterized protein n=1 Tax=Mesobacillus foraminis TaxID=279826 RepID=A0A4R2B7K1_9BACI|nr:hypothetical protein [Mesobacillus foraminis]TCN21369.1 hypothetical protein EV146_11250 [Mesobacillus foraminis]
MYYIILLFLANILAGFALLEVAGLSGLGMLAGLMPFLKVVAVILIIVFSLGLFYLGLKSLFNGSWRK